MCLLNVTYEDDDACGDETHNDNDILVWVPHRADPKTGLTSGRLLGGRCFWKILQWNRGK